MSIKQFQQEISKGLPHRAYLIHSTEDFLLYETLTVIKEKYAGSDAFNFDVFDIKSPDFIATVEQIIDVMNTLPFLAERKTVVMRNIQKLSKKDIKKLEGYIASPSATTLLVMLYEGKAPKLFDVSASRDLKIISVNLQEQDIPLWVKERAKGKGIRFTDKAVEYLICYAGTDPGMLYSEIEKFASWDTSDVIDADDIKGIVYAGAEYDAFDIINALGKRNIKEVFRIFENVNKNTDPQMLLGALNWQYASMYSKSQKKDEGKFRKIFRLLHEADIANKTSCQFVLEDLFVKLLRIN